MGAVICTIHGMDCDGRALGVCQDADGIDLNGWLVPQGRALAYQRYSTTYVPQENQAKAAQLGLRAGEFTPPWEWRREKRLHLTLSKIIRRPTRLPPMYVQRGADDSLPGREEDTLMSIGAVLALVVALTASSAWAHPGGLATDGCHYCRTNCAKQGEVEGALHCHEERQKARSRQNVRPPARHLQATPDRIRNIPIEIWGSTPRVVDADTLEVAGQKVRLQGIDAPESAQSCRRATGQRYRCGASATQALRTRIGTGAVVCKIEGRDRYNRALGICYTADGTDLNGWLVRQGYALAYRRYSTTYVP